MNVSPRIFKINNEPPQVDPSFGNIELISEKICRYWIEGAKDIKRDFPNKVLIGSIMAGFNKDDWIELTKMTNEAGFDMLELNLSCPHGMNEKGMGRACGENPDTVE
jgi:dihydropyrimidine dehydrogenase (NADP+)